MYDLTSIIIISNYGNLQKGKGGDSNANEEAYKIEFGHVHQLIVIWLWKEVWELERYRLK